MKQHPGFPLDCPCGVSVDHRHPTGDLRVVDTSEVNTEPIPLNELIKARVEEFDSFMKMPDIVERFRDKTCIVCGQPHNKSKQVAELRSFLIASMQQVADAAVEQIEVERPAPFSGMISEQGRGAIAVRSRLLRWAGKG